MKMERLQKAMAEAGVASRRASEKLIVEGHVKVNGKLVTELGTKVSSSDQVTVDGVPLEREQPEYYLLNKPRGVITSAHDEHGRKTVVDILKEGGVTARIYPVGRLDYDTTGVLLLTNDGKLSNDLLAPGKHVEKTYYARIKGMVTKKEVAAFAEGVDIGDELLTAPAELKIHKAGSESEIEITITEGRYHQIKRMFEAVGMQVLYLKRLRMGPLYLDESLACGEYRKLTTEEIQSLKNREEW